MCGPVMHVCEASSGKVWNVLLVYNILTGWSRKGWSLSWYTCGA